MNPLMTIGLYSDDTQWKNRIFCPSSLHMEMFVQLPEGTKILPWQEAYLKHETVRELFDKYIPDAVNQVYNDAVNIYSADASTGHAASNKVKDAREVVKKVEELKHLFDTVISKIGEKDRGATIDSFLKT